jgi:hypothetical protein
VTSPYEVVEHTHDVVGTGGAGLRAALGMASSGLIDCRDKAERRRGPAEKFPALREKIPSGLEKNSLLTADESLPCKSREFAASL